MPLFELKPIEAMQLTKENQAAIEWWLDVSAEIVDVVDKEYVVLKNDTSSHRVFDGQYIIRDLLSPLGYVVMDQKVFEARYQQITSH